MEFPPLTARPTDETGTSATLLTVAIRGTGLGKPEASLADLNISLIQQQFFDF
jgi:hypothetical protein